MKSSKDNLRKRGFTYESDIDLLNNKSQSELFELLFSNIATVRTASIRTLANNCINETEFTDLLLNLLTKEKALYTKIAICETLEKGNVHTASKIIKYLGKIGNNQHKELPEAVSLKKSYPLPRDIIARSLGRMSISIFPTLIDVLKTENIDKISESLDAIGFMVFYNPKLATLNNATAIYNTITKYKENPLILWKCTICLSAFPLEETVIILTNIKEENQDNILSKEADRSLKLINIRLIN